MRLTVDMFCRVIDNFGDAGVCLRLARDLVLHHACSVRLFCDDVVLLQRFEPSPHKHLVFYNWAQSSQCEPAQAVVCGFGCDLDVDYVARMMACAVQPAYVHLEYLSAEPWVESTHGVWSIHPRRLTRQRFFNPGFTAKTGGLLRSQAAIRPESMANAFNTLCQRLNLQASPAIPSDAMKVFVFAYPTISLNAFIAAAKQSKQAIHWVIPHGHAGEVLQTALQYHVEHFFTRLPWLSQADFDVALRCCDVAWVRGEDSAVSAMFAGLPMLWQLYPQDDGAEQVKLQAYLEAVRHALPAANLDVWCAAMQAANARDSSFAQEHTRAFGAFLDQFGTTRPHHHHHALWAKHCLESVPDLSATLVDWVKNWRTA